MTDSVIATSTERVLVPKPLPGSGRGRWLIGLAVAGTAVAVTLVAVLVLGGRQTPDGLRYVPADALIVAELRLDLPGDQLQKVGNLLAHFPGFADQSILADKLDRAGERLVEALTNGTVSYTRDLKAWVSGPLYVALRGVGTTTRLMPQPSGLVIATTNGVVGCDDLFDGRATTSEAYRGHDIVVLGSMQSAGAPACVVDDRHVLAGDLESVRAGLRARAAGDGIAASDRYLAARAALAGDQLATMFVSRDALERLGELRGGLPTGATMPFAASLPDWSMVGVRAEDDALVIDSVSAALPVPNAAPSLLSLAPGHPSELTRHVPDGAIAYAEVQAAGPSVLNAIALLRAEPTLAEPLAQLDQVLTAFGGADKLLGWVEDAGVVVINDGSEMTGTPAAGVLLLAPDEATARARVDTYRSLLAIAALGGSVELEQTEIGDVEVTTVTVTDTSAQLFGKPVQVRLARSGRLVVIGTTEAVTAALLATDGEGSLAESDSFAAATARGLSNPRSMMYLSVGHGLAFGQAFLSAAEAADFTANTRPYLEPIEAFHVSTIEGPTGRQARIVMTVTQPEQP